MFTTAPATRNCQDILDRRGHLLLGVSAFNSRFSDNYVFQLARWARSRSQEFDFLLSGDEASLLIEATGTPPGEARRKARKAISRNRRSAEEALLRNGIDGD